MRVKFTPKQKLMEISSIVVWLVWIISVIIVWNRQLLSLDHKGKLTATIIFSLIIYAILTCFTFIPEATNIITSKKYNNESKGRIIKISRSFFSSLKLIILLGMACLTVVQIFIPDLEMTITYLLYGAMVMSFIAYWVAYKKIPKE